MTGWIKLHRSILQWEWYADWKVWRVFEHLLLRANFEETEWRGRKITRGQIVISYTELAGRTGLTVQQVRTALDKLRKTEEITCKGCNKFSTITINNYTHYQGEGTANKVFEATNTQLGTQLGTPTRTEITRQSTRTNKAKNCINRPQKDTGGGDINTQATTPINTQPNTQGNTPERGEITTSKEVKKIQEGKKGRNKEPKETHIDFIFKQGGGVSVDNSADDTVIGAFEPLDENWWPSKDLCRLCNEAGLIDEAIRTIRMRYISVCNKRRFVYSNPDRGFVLFCKSYVSESLKDSGLSPDKVADSVAKFMSSVWPIKKGGKKKNV